MTPVVPSGAPGMVGANHARVFSDDVLNGRILYVAESGSDSDR